jgi:hypothetical protein
MKTIKRTDTIEKVSLTILGALFGLAIKAIFPLGNLWFLTVALPIVIIIVIVLYHRQSQHIGRIDEMLEEISETIHGKGAVYYNTVEEYYLEASKLIENSEEEILTFNDYLNIENPKIGFNTPSHYYESLERTLEKAKKNTRFRFIQIYHIPHKENVTWSTPIRNHFKNLLELHSAFLGKLEIARIVQVKYDIYQPFTIIDKRHIRLSVWGANIQNGGAQPKIAGGLVIRDNPELVKPFLEWFNFIYKLSVPAPLENIIDSTTINSTK